MRHHKIDQLVAQMKSEKRCATTKLTEEQIYLLQQSAKANLTAAAVYDIWRKLGYPERTYSTVKNYYRNVQQSLK